MIVETTIGRFEANKAEVEVLLHSLSSTATTDMEKVVCRASVVLLVAHFEGYLKDLALEYVDQVDAMDYESQMLPFALRDLHVQPRIDEISATRDGQQKRKLLEKLHGSSVLFASGAKPSKGTLKSAVLARRVTSARPDVIDQMFAYMGSLDKPCDGALDFESVTTGELVTRNIRFSLEEVVQCRNDIAHGDAGRSPTREDATSYSEFLLHFARRLHRAKSALVSELEEKI
ncbi:MULTISPECIES: MAE_28990/MAE_18760 family HEPN-like nuclease [unclassified Pseudoclavibacter]|uniref:MAE_28990/MAE_18760 family HEPN-like nuclease n=1 Tax=unclassified Pseudoclavibacter TaxID=2615177 RepID=UPI001BADDFEF|nr:MAE_28990/MAE_18760 family HEPN-like nuclease [Pseudoclavibacter sp. Marseille-Q4354]MBS3179905.1 hypothetical protein [Pseudoclavibacter sp. Marseille-Q4354]